MSHESKMVGQWSIVLYGPCGNIKEARNGYNVITTVGKEALAKYLSSAATAATTNTIRYVAVGTGSTAEAAGDTALGTELTRVTGTVSYTSGAIVNVVATFAAGVGTGAIAEYGLFNSLTAGTLFSRDTESVVTKGASDILVTSMTITFS